MTKNNAIPERTHSMTDQYFNFNVEEGEKDRS